MRLLTLVSLAKGSKELSYASVAAGLQVEASGARPARCPARCPSRCPSRCPALDDAPAPRPPTTPLPNPTSTPTRAPTAPLVARCAEVESWVMQAISAGLLMAKMNQLTSEVLVSFCTEREFSEKQWGSLQESLVDWRDSIRGLLQVVQTARPQA